MSNVKEVIERLESPFYRPTRDDAFTLIVALQKCAEDLEWLTDKAMEEGLNSFASRIAATRSDMKYKMGID